MNGFFSDIDSVTKKAIHTSSQLEQYINEGYKILSLVPSCSLMLKYEWSLLMPENEKIKKLSMNTFDICEFLVEKLSNGIPKNFLSLLKLMTLLAFIFRVIQEPQNVGQKSNGTLKFIPKP